MFGMFYLNSLHIHCQEISRQFQEISRQFHVSFTSVATLSFQLFDKATQSLADSALPGFLPQGSRGRPPETVHPPRDLLLLLIFGPKNNRKISITKEIYITIDFAPLKKFLEESQLHGVNVDKSTFL